MKNLFILIFVLLLFLILYLITVNNDLRGSIKNIKMEHAHLISKEQNIEKWADSILVVLSNRWGDTLFNQYEKVRSENKADFLKEIQDEVKIQNDRLVQIKKEIDEGKINLDVIKENAQRLNNNFPELITLDELYNKYVKSNGEEFLTTKGNIKFYKSDIEFVITPSINKVASIRIGKEESSENSALIKSFLEESVQSKIKQGYKLVSTDIKPTDYGQYTRKYYAKADSYFITYYQYTRYQGTYNSTYFRYRYYVEIGSKSRKEKFEKEQFSNKLGN